MTGTMPGGLRVLPATPTAEDSMTDRGACAGRTYLERGVPVVVLVGWRGPGPRNVLIARADGTLVVRPFRGLRRVLAGGAA